jgi:peptidoglycan/xylan/chitin deacetylase (PgdA/CDA1 family)
MKKIILFVILVALIVGSCRSITTFVPQDLSKKKVFFSFDDGPNAHEDTTARLLDVLQKYHIIAMFALLGKNVEQNPHLVRRIYDEGHIIVNHGYSGKWAIEMKDEEFRDNLFRGEAAIVTALGIVLQPKLYRPHGGFYSYQHEKIWREEGWELVGGNIRAYDAALSEAGKQKVIRSIINKTEKSGGGIILLHDAKDTYTRMEMELAKNPRGSYNRSWIPDTVEEIIIALLQKGYQFN